MTTFISRVLASLLVSLSLVACAAEPLEPVEPPEDVPLFTQAELDQMLAPVALYPDELLSQLLMAATYPLEVVEAARFSRANPDLKGQDAVRAADSKPWDPSVKAMLAFPQILDRMDQDLDWTRRLGDAFLAQQEQVMDTVQALRQRADEAGNLAETEHVQVVREERTIIVRNRYPDVVYVPYYDPTLIYGSWWWPDYAPVRWSPWRGYRYYSGYNGFFWGPSIVVGYGFFFSHYDWHDRYIRIVEVPPFYYRRPPPPRYRWDHDYHHRKGVPYRHRRVYERYHDENDPVPRRPPRDQRDDDGKGRGGDRQPPGAPREDGEGRRTPPAEGGPRGERPDRERPAGAGSTAPAPAPVPPTVPGGGTDTGVPGARPEVDQSRGGDREGRTGKDSAGGRRDSPAYTSPQPEMPTRGKPAPVTSPSSPPSYSAPERDKPGYSTPKRETPSYSAPPREAPSYSAPKRETPSYSAPPREAPSYSAPKRETPSYSAPPRETPSYSAPKRETPTYSAPQRETPSYTPPPRSESSSQRSDGGKQQRNRERPEQRP